VIVLILAALVYAGCMISLPSLMDDVDAVQAQIARKMLTSGDW
jgi:4-amino-4-deoxy-L-arabinose transferase-like glycosyltransferase